MSQPRQWCGLFLLPLAPGAVGRPAAGPALCPVLGPVRRRCWRFLPVACFFLGLAAARAQFPVADQKSAGSVSGQFFVSRVDDDAPAYQNLNLAADTNLLRLKPAVLAVAAERFKSSLWRQLGIPAGAAWSGKIFLCLHPARSGNDTVTIAAMPFLNRWDYRVDLPDTLARVRYARALSGVLLLEIANRRTPRDGHSAEVPSWLVDGLAQQVLAADGDKVVLSAPTKKDEEFPVNRLNQTERGLDPLASARRILQIVQPLTFDQLSWPTDEQMVGEDGGLYYASAQLFQSELLGLKNGPGKMQALLAELPAHLNWQTAFFQAFGADFQRPLEVEKWWALRTIAFSERAPGPRWTTDVSIVRLQQLLSVPVEFRSESNALPAHAEISLQTALQSLTPDQREVVIQTKARDLALVELRLAPPFGSLADAYRVTLAGFLGDLKKDQMYAVNKHGVPTTQRTTMMETVAQLNALDVRRRTAEVRSLGSVPGKSPPAAAQPAPPGPPGF
ncbi:MAG: hypothetical protein ABSH48_00075 [Verrucomicrobiota bacterium]